MMNAVRSPLPHHSPYSLGLDLETSASERFLGRNLGELLPFPILLALSAALPLCSLGPFQSKNEASRHTYGFKLAFLDSTGHF